MTNVHRTALWSAVALAFLFSGCTCQREENVQAKQRMSQPPPPNPILELALEKLDFSDLSANEKARDRINRMTYAEIRARLGTFQLESEGNLTFSRGPMKVKSYEKTRLLQSFEENFSLVQEASDNDRMQVIYVNEVLFLKNKNGKWRTSRDPTGERSEMLGDASGVWRSFYDLFEHALVWERAADTVMGDREVVLYDLEVKDLVSELPPVPKFAGAVRDAGVPRDGPRPPGQLIKRISDKESMSRLRKWRELARAEGGKGQVYIDRKTGVLLAVNFTGNLIIGDDKTKKSELRVQLSLKIKDVGLQKDINVPKDAISEVHRKKWPVHPRKFLEKQGLVEPLPPTEDGNK